MIWELTYIVIGIIIGIIIRSLYLYISECISDTIKEIKNDVKWQTHHQIEEHGKSWHFTNDVEAALIKIEERKKGFK